MEIRLYCFCLLINCALFLPSTVCKPVSLNDIIAAEERSAAVQTRQLKESESQTINTRVLPKNYKLYTITKHMTSSSIAQRDKKVSPIKYRKTFQIRTPLKPKKIKYSFKPRRRRLNSSTKREIDNDETFNRNYIPLLKSLSVLFNNILDADSGDDDDTDDFYDKQQSISRSEECTCARRTDYETKKRKSSKKATTVTSPIASTVPEQAEAFDLTEASSAPAFNTFNDNNSSLRRNKNLPLLPARNSTSSRRNNNGLGKGSVSTHNGNFAGNISRNNGSDENDNSGGKTTETYPENHKQHTNGSSGDDASCNGSCRDVGGNRNNTSNSASETPTIETINGSNETFTNDGGDSNQFEGYDNIETRGDKTESRILLSQSSSRLRRTESQEETAEILWQIENPKESSYDVTYNFTRNQRLPNRDGSVASEDKEIRRTNQKLTLDDVATIFNTSKSNLTEGKDKQKIVVIYDGYSIAKDVNGENKFTEKAYIIR